jgi:hypothetical protein
LNFSTQTFKKAVKFSKIRYREDFTSSGLPSKRHVLLHCRLQNSLAKAREEKQDVNKTTKSNTNLVDEDHDT